MTVFDTSNTAPPAPISESAAAKNHAVPRLKSQDVMQHSRELEIDHEGRIYRLRVTQLNKLILTA